MKEVLNYWKRVFTNLNYLILAVVIALFFYATNVFIAQLNTMISLYSSLGLVGTIKLFFISIIGFWSLVKIESYISLIIISLLIGMLFSLIFYKVVIIKGDGNKAGLITSLGLFISVIAPGCAVCGIGLASILGLSAIFINFFPYDGLELSFLAIIILIYAIFKVSNNSCRTMLNKTMKGGEI